MIRVAELFAGVGGFRLALESVSDFSVVWSNQWEPSTKKQYASEIYVERFGANGHSNEDIATVDTSTVPDFDMLVGGFPCQNYSVAAPNVHTKGIEGKKGVLWWEIHRFLKDKKPKICLFENVDRLLKSPAKQQGRDFSIILACLGDLGYTVEWRIVNAADYGEPQRRKRVFILAYFEGVFSQDLQMMDIAFPCTEIDGNRASYELVGELHEISLSAKFQYQNRGVLKGRKVETWKVESTYDGHRKTLGDCLQQDEEVDESFFDPEIKMARWVYEKGAKSEEKTHPTTGFKYIYNEGPMPFPDPIDKPSRTIITTEGSSSALRESHVIRKPGGRYRRLTPIELERLNGFPDNHTEGCSNVKRGFLMGNALVVGVVKRIAETIAKHKLIFRSA